MEIEVRIPSMLRRLTANQGTVKMTGGTVGELIDNLEANYPGMKEQLIAEDGTIHRFVNIYLDDEDIRFIDKLATPVAGGSVITILPAIAGGR